MPLPMPMPIPLLCSPCSLPACWPSSPTPSGCATTPTPTPTPTPNQAELAYAIGLCYYQQKQFGPALKHLAEIIERGVREHPELSVGSQTEGIEVRPPWAS